MKKPELWYSVVVRDRDGKVISKKRRKSKSFVRRWNEIIYAQVTGSALDSLIIPFSINLRMILVFDGPKEDQQSIVVGTGDTPVAVTDTDLAAKIAHGLGPGQLSYETPTVSTATVSGSNCEFVVGRVFVNYSGAEIVARESGIFVRAKGTVYYTVLLVVRDVFETPQAIPDGGSLSLSYTLRITA